MAQTFTGMQLQKRLRMIAGIRIHAVDNTELIGMFGGLGKQFRHPETTLAMALEIEHRPGMGCLRLLRLVIKGIKMRRAAGHAEKNHALGARPQRGSPGFQPMAPLGQGGFRQHR